jgi:hypothetical protein
LSSALLVRVGTAGDDDVGLAALDGRGGERHGLQARRARSGAGHGFDVCAELQVEHDLATDVGGVAGQDDPTPDQSVELRPGDGETLQERPDGRVPEGDGVHLGEVGEGLHEGGADAPDDDGAAGAGPGAGR